MDKQPHHHAIVVSGRSGRRPCVVDVQPARGGRALHHHGGRYRITLVIWASCARCSPLGPLDVDSSCYLNNNNQKFRAEFTLCG